MIAGYEWQSDEAKIAFSVGKEKSKKTLRKKKKALNISKKAFSLSKKIGKSKIRPKGYSKSYLRRL